MTHAFRGSRLADGRWWVIISDHNRPNHDRTQIPVGPQSRRPQVLLRIGHSLLAAPNPLKSAFHASQLTVRDELGTRNLLRVQVLNLRWRPHGEVVRRLEELSGWLAFLNRLNLEVIVRAARKPLE